MQRRFVQRTTNKLNLLALRRQYTNPHQLYDRLRDRDSLYFDETGQCWLATGHKVVTSILDDPRFLSSSGSATGSASYQFAPVNRQLLFMDGEKHRSAQDVVLRPLAQMVKTMPPFIKTIVQDALVAVQQTGEMEAVSQFASPISLFTIAHVLGMPVEDSDMLRQLEQWSDTFGDITSGYFRSDVLDVQKLEDYFRKLIAQKRRNPDDSLISALIAAHDIFPEEDDLVANCMMVFAAGRITTKKLLGNGITLLMQNWEQHKVDFQADPRFVKPLGEELLRMISPTRYLIREAGEDVLLPVPTFGEHVIRRGQRILLFLEAADYDPAVFAQPGVLDPHRRPNKHIAFGFGPHQCPGATLARVEVQLALEGLFTFSSLRSKPDTNPAWNPNPNLGGFVSNSVIFDPVL